ncbi:MAG: hypothetical protein HYT46_00225 [Candidatus Vogelbacteria bacterium]|nr:hypothetical protein [Candidatus Vogelbacteria bacterium]
MARLRKQWPMGYLAGDLIYAKVGDGKERMGEVMACFPETVPDGCVPMVFFASPLSNWGIIPVPADDLEPLFIPSCG